MNKGKGKGITLKGTPTDRPMKRVNPSEAAQLIARVKAKRKEPEGMLECERKVLRL